MNISLLNHIFLSFGIEKLEQTGKEYIINGEIVKARKKTNNKWFETQDSISYWDLFIIRLMLQMESAFVSQQKTLL